MGTDKIRGVYNSHWKAFFESKHDKIEEISDVKTYVEDKFENGQFV